MLKLNFHSLFLVFGVIILLTVCAGCGRAGDKTPDSKENTQSNEEQQTPDIVDSGSSVASPASMMTENDKIVSLRAEPYITSVISWDYSLDIKIEDGKIYINDTLYKKSSSVPPVILYSDALLHYANHADKINNNQKMVNTLTKIKNSTPCYLLETDQVCKTGQKLSVYEIDGTYYFVRFFDNGEVMRIHYATVE